MPNRYDIVSDDRINFERSEAKNFLIFKTGQFELNKPAGTDSVSQVVEHRLGYIPGVLAFFSFNESDYSRLPYGAIVAAQFYQTIEALIDDTQVEFKITEIDPLNPGVSVGRDLTIKYYILRESAN